MYYHISETENKESILAKGLETYNGVIFLAATISDDFLLAPVMGGYYYGQHYYRSTYHLLEWEILPLRITLFGVDVNGLDLEQRVNHNRYWFLEKYNLPISGRDRDVTEFLSREPIDSSRIKPLEDFELPCLKVSTDISLLMRYRQKTIGLRRSGLSENEINELREGPPELFYYEKDEQFMPLIVDHEETFFDDKDLCTTGASIINTMIGSGELDTSDVGRDFLKNGGMYSELVRSCLGELRTRVLFKSLIHGQLHIERVVLLAGIIAEQQRLTEEETITLLYAGAYHDLGRENDWYDPAHGQRSAERIAKCRSILPSSVDLSIIQASVATHSTDDRTIHAFMDKYSVPENKRQECIKICNCLKDADGLDRVRLRDLNINYLRFEESKKLKEFAEWLFLHTARYEIWR